MPRFFRPFVFVIAGLLLFLVIPSMVAAQPSAAPSLTPPPSGVVLYDNRAAFNADAPGLPLEDWEEGHVSGPFIFCNPPLNTSSNDACFLPGEILPGLEFQDAPLGGGSDQVGLGGPGSWSMPSKFVYSNYSVETTNLFFTPTVTAIGLDLSSNGIGNTILISVYDAGATLILTDTTLVGNLGELTFWGVISSIPIERLNIDILNSEFVDNVAFGGALPPITPTPSPTVTPSVTPTATPTVTPTPSPTPEVPTVVSVASIKTLPDPSRTVPIGGIGLLLTVGILWMLRRQ